MNSSDSMVRAIVGTQVYLLILPVVIDPVTGRPFSG